MGGLFDDDETAGSPVSPVGGQTHDKDGALFPVDTQAHRTDLADRESTTGCKPVALFQDVTAGSEPAVQTTLHSVPNTSVAALPLDGLPTADQRKPCISTTVVAPLSLDELPTAAQAAPKSVIQPHAGVQPHDGVQPTTLAHDSVPAPQRTIISAPQPQEVFQESEDPLVHKALQHALEKYPDGFERKKRMLKARFETLLPLDFDRISDFSAGTLPHVQVVLREVSESSRNLSAISVSTVIQEITMAARDAAARGNAGGSAPSHGLSGLLKRVEQSVRRFDPDAAQNTLMRLYGGVKSIHSRLSGIGDLAQETMTAIQVDVMVMGVIAYMAEGTAFAQQTQRRHDLLLTTGQELQLAQKQLEALRAQTENALMQIEEVRTVTLPSLGFLGAIR